MKNIPFCAKCYSSETASNSNGSFRLVGCKELTKQEWEEGWKSDAGEAMPYQHNCPLMQDIEDKEEQQRRDEKNGLYSDKWDDAN